MNIFKDFDTHCCICPDIQWGAQACFSSKSIDNRGSVLFWAGGYPVHRSYLNVSIIPLFGGVTQSSKQTTPKTSRSLGENLTNKSLIFLFPTQTVTLPVATQFHRASVQPGGRAILWLPGKDGFRTISPGHTLRSRVVVPLISLSS